MIILSWSRQRRLYFFLSFCTPYVFFCRDNPETISLPRPSQIPPDYNPPKTLPVDMKSIQYFDQAELYTKPELRSTLEWRKVRPVSNIEFELPSKLDIEANYQILNGKLSAESIGPLILERYSYADLSLKKHLQKHPEAGGSEAGTLSVRFEVIPRLKLKEYVTRRIKEDHLFYSKVNRTNTPKGGFYVRTNDMFTDIHELWMEDHDRVYCFRVTEPNGSIPEESRLKEADILHILFSLKLTS